MPSAISTPGLTFYMPSTVVGMHGLKILWEFSILRLIINGLNQISIQMLRTGLGVVEKKRRKTNFKVLETILLILCLKDFTNKKCFHI